MAPFFSVLRARLNQGRAGGWRASLQKQKTRANRPGGGGGLRRWRRRPKADNKSSAFLKTAAVRARARYQQTQLPAAAEFLAIYMYTVRPTQGRGRAGESPALRESPRINTRARPLQYSLRAPGVRITYVYIYRRVHKTHPSFGAPSALSANILFTSRPSCVLFFFPSAPSYERARPLFSFIFIFARALASVYGSTPP